MKKWDLLKQRSIDKEVSRRIFDFTRIVLTLVGDVAEISIKSFFPHPYYHVFCKHRAPSFQTTLFKLQRNRLIAQSKDTKKFFVLTEAGKKEYKKILTRLLYEEKKQEPWDKKWRLLIFDVPEQYKKYREFLRRELVGYGFTQLQKSVWISPYHVADELKQILEDHGLNRWTKLMVIDILFDDTLLRKKFNL